MFEERTIYLNRTEIPISLVANEVTLHHEYGLRMMKYQRFGQRIFKYLSLYADEMISFIIFQVALQIMNAPSTVNRNSNRHTHTNIF